MTHEADPGLWQTVGIAIVGILAGIGGVFGLKKKPAGESEDTMHGQVQALQYEVRDMRSEIAHLKENLSKDAEALRQLGEKHDHVVVKIFERMENIGLEVNTIKTEIRLALSRSAQ